MSNIYTKSMSQALQEARDYREPEELTEMLPEPVKGYWDKDGAARGVPDIFYSMKKGNQKKNIHPKDLEKFEKDGWRWYDSTTESKGHLSYDDWLKQVKGIKKGAYGVNSDEHAKYSEEWRAYIKGLFDNLPPINANYSESNLDEIVGGHGDMTITKDGGVMIIKTKDWQTFKAKGWLKKEEVENESLELPATGAITSNSTGQEDESEELDEASRLRPIKGLYTMAQMKKQVARTEKAFKEFEQHCDFIFQMEVDVGPSGGDNSGKYWNVHSVLDNANNQIKKALADAKKIT